MLGLTMHILRIVFQQTLYAVCLDQNGQKNTYKQPVNMVMKAASRQCFTLYVPLTTCTSSSFLTGIDRTLCLARSSEESGALISFLLLLEGAVKCACIYLRKLWNYSRMPISGHTVACLAARLLPLPLISILVIFNSPVQHKHISFKGNCAAKV